MTLSSIPAFPHCLKTFKGLKLNCPSAQAKRGFDFKQAVCVDRSASISNIHASSSLLDLPSKTNVAELTFLWYPHYLRSSSWLKPGLSFKLSGIPYTHEAAVFWLAESLSRCSHLVIGDAARVLIGAQSMSPRGVKEIPQSDTGYLPAVNDIWSLCLQSVMEFFQTPGVQD